MEQLDKYIDKTDTCWNWIGGKSHGYGATRVNGKRKPAHRVIYEIIVGKIPDKYELDHLCRNHSCVNPKHLEPVTHKDNVLRGDSPSAVNARRTHCLKGHEFNDANTYKWTGKRRCKKCVGNYNKTRNLKLKK